MALAVPARALSLQARFEDPCACQKWKDVYNSSAAQCGDGYEYFAATQKGLTLQLATRYLKSGFCDEFFQKLDDDACVNLVHGNKAGMWYSGKTWCWVDGRCSIASEVAYNAEVHAKVKFCGSDDAMLGQLLPSDLVNYAKTHDLDLGLCSKMAYPVEGGIKWDDFKEKVMDEFCGRFKDEPELMPVGAKGPRMLSMEGKLQELLAKADTHAKAVILVNKGGKPPFGVVTGQSVMEVRAQEASLVDRNHPATQSSMYCICGSCA